MIILLGQCCIDPVLHERTCPEREVDFDKAIIAIEEGMTKGFLTVVE
jgi:hypothetical protein